MSGEVVVLQCQNPEALALPAVTALFSRGFAFSGFPDAGEARRYLAETIPSDEIALFFVRRDEALVGMAVIEHVSYVFGAPGPMILHFYCPKDEEARLALAEALRLWARERGAESVYACHQRGALSDDDFMARFEPVSNGRVFASVLEFEARREEPVAW